ncbi:MAG: hypothetical protein NWF13_03865 [Candidatus Bathyarchaeota archaeon]|nr:hypothetical protein [Candidatus Bathyarchaeota archaeon]
MVGLWVKDVFSMSSLRFVIPETNEVTVSLKKVVSSQILVKEEHWNFVLLLQTILALSG